MTVSGETGDKGSRSRRRVSISSGSGRNSSPSSAGESEISEKGDELKHGRKDSHHGTHKSTEKRREDIKYRKEEDIVKPRKVSNGEGKENGADRPRDQSGRSRDHNGRSKEQRGGGGEGSVGGRSSSSEEENNGKHTGEFLVKYLGKRDARGLWGIKHTRKPVDEMVGLARGLQPGTPLPYLYLGVSEQGVTITPHPKNLNENFDGGLYPIDTISYGVQDLIYTRVFAMIIVKDTPETREGSSVRKHPFECHAFVCESRQSARRLTFALANAFQIFSRTVKNNQKKRGNFAIDLRPPEQIEKEYRNQLDSEA